jgi:hypothetical protein
MISIKKKFETFFLSLFRKKNILQQLFIVSIQVFILFFRAWFFFFFYFFDIKGRKKNRFCMTISRLRRKHEKLNFIFLFILQTIDSFNFFFPLNNTIEENKILEEC